MKRLKTFEFFKYQEPEVEDITIDDLSDDLMESLINKDVERADDSYKLGK